MGLYTYFFEKDRFARQYNCSFYSVEDVALEKRQHLIYAVIVLTLFVVYEVSIWRFGWYKSKLRHLTSLTNNSLFSDPLHSMPVRHVEKASSAEFLLQAHVGNGPVWRIYFTVDCVVARNLLHERLHVLFIPCFILHGRRSYFPWVSWILLF
jgi:hypothetical protein